MQPRASTPAWLLDGRPRGEAIHATAVAIAGAALLILGPSKSGKSRLALALIGASTRRRPIRLVGDDRILLSTDTGRLIARPHPRIAGFIERRGLGIVADSYVTAAPVRGIVALGPTTLPPVLTPNFPCLPFVIDHMSCRPDVQRGAVDAVLGWWRDACTTGVAKAIAAR